MSGLQAELAEAVGKTVAQRQRAAVIGKRDRRVVIKDFGVGIRVCPLAQLIQMCGQLGYGGVREAVRAL
ncbi:MAG: hypothetical protein E6I18_12730 [Chloroflexi bacterium]|nr:MAG: hypothetical protein E6I18_12730 [Chloroflexota bacterium]